ncbi:neuromedin-S isoform X2 [Equus asinus]|uniref:neuromedin-S isoform X2 n=1 Tax=Equus asinus TaxID=9793 RepID=UPI0038F7EAB7
MLYSCPGGTHLWPVKRKRTLKMKHLLPLFSSILAIYCFCMLQIPSSGRISAQQRHRVFPGCGAVRGADRTRTSLGQCPRTKRLQGIRGFPQPLADPPDGLDIVWLKLLPYWTTLSRQSKGDQDVCKRFLFHYSRTQEPTHPVKTGFPPVHPLMRLAAKLADRRMKRFLQRDSGAVAVDFTRKDHAATLGRALFLFRNSVAKESWIR